MGLVWLSPLATGLLLGLLAQAGVIAGAFGWCVSGHFRWTVALAGLFGNTTPGLVVAALLFATLRNRKRALVVGFAGLFLVQSFITISCTEFMLERGTPITPMDMVNGFDPHFLATQIRIFFSKRFGPFLALAVLMFGAGAYGLARRRRRPGHGALEFAPILVVGALAALSLWVHRTPRGKHARRPYSGLIGAVVTANHLNIVVGIEPPLLARPVTDVTALPGLSMMGMATTRCADGMHVAEPISSRPAAEAAPLQTVFRALAEHLGTRGRPVSFTFMLLESVGAEDIYALDETAPEGLTPYLDRLARGAETTLVGRRVMQAGQRTAWAMSALLCGAGTGPFLLAPLRDLPHVKLRCWPDLAADAGADLRFFYADNLRFDRYQGSLQDHGFRYLHTPRVEGRARGAWGLSDQELFKDVLEDLRAGSPPDGVATAPRIRGILTLSTHGPFDRPEDMPEAGRDRAAALAEAATDNTTKQAHWITVSYLDQALSRFIPALMDAEAVAGFTPVVLLVGDHTSGVTVSKHPLASARIPMFWLFPSSSDPERIAPVQRALDARDWSQNDLARMVLSLLDRTGALASLPTDKRWHSMGGQALSPSFSMPDPWQQTRLWSIDVHARSRLLGAAGEVLLEELAEPPSTRTDLDTSTKTCDAALPGLAWLLQHPERFGPCDSATPPVSDDGNAERSPPFGSNSRVP